MRSILWDHPTYPCSVLQLQQAIRRARFQNRCPTHLNSHRHWLAVPEEQYTHLSAYSSSEDEFRHIPKDSSREPCTALSYPEIQKTCVNWTDVSNLSQRPVALRQPHQPCSGQPCLPSRAVSAEDFHLSVGTGFPVSRLRDPPSARFDVAQSFRKRFRRIEVEAGSFTPRRLVTAAPARLGARGYRGLS